MKTLFLLGLAMPQLLAEKPIRMEVLLQQSHSLVEGKSFVTATNPKQLASVLKSSFDTPPKLPEIFSKNCFYAFLFLGERTSGGYSVELVGLNKTKDQVIFREAKPKKGMMTASVITHPFIVISVPNSLKIKGYSMEKP